jgi:hypothetical protein
MGGGETEGQKRINQSRDMAKSKKTGKRKTGEGHSARKREERSKRTKTKNEGIMEISEKKERANRIADDERKKTGFEFGNGQGKENSEKN